jgi:hypothetical protein
MSSPPAGIPEAEWMATPASVRTLILVQQQEIQALRQENDNLRSQLTSLATELASLRERIGRSSRNSSKPPSSDGPGFKPPERRKGSGRKRDGQLAIPYQGPGPIQSLSQVLLPRLPAWAEAGGIASSLCSRASLPQPISI